MKNLLGDTWRDTFGIVNMMTKCNEEGRLGDNPELRASPNL